MLEMDDKRTPGLRSGPILPNIANLRKQTEATLTHQLEPLFSDFGLVWRLHTDLRAHEDDLAHIRIPPEGHHIRGWKK